MTHWPTRKLQLIYGPKLYLTIMIPASRWHLGLENYLSFQDSISGANSSL